ncbi:MAG TPA: 4a-hydroxytetrahydrobiopterin dehydratase [Leeuwenhoekiella sp.]|nr:4a-hydroxytetrahydrobiopterin dehydratase [Leeuwenhoekiella sp.]
MKKLDDNTISERLEKIDGWEYEEGAIHTSIEFEDFKEAFATMTRIAFEAESQQHHPEWTNTYNQLNISLSTHDANGVTEKDFKLAHAIEKIIGS